VSLKGRTTEFPLRVLITLLADQKKTGELALRGSSGEGALGLAEGRVVAAVFGDESPIPALGAVFDMRDADFEFTPWNDPPPANLEGELDELLRKADDHRRWLAGVREVIPNDRVRFRLSERAADQGAVTFTSDRWRVVLAVNGSRDVNDLAAHLRIDRDAALDLLAGLVRDGVIETVEPSAAAPEPEPAPPPRPEPEPPAPAAEVGPTPAPAPEWSAPPPAQEWAAPGQEQEWMPPAPEPPAAPEQPSAAMDDRLAALFGPTTTEPAAPAKPAADEWAAPPASDWSTPAPAADQWSTPAPAETAPEAPPAVDPRLGALAMPPAMEPAPPPPPANEWAPPPTIEAPAPRKKGLFGRFRKEDAAAGTSQVAEAGAMTRTGKLAAFANALLGEYNSGTYGKGRIDDRIASLLMRVDEQADPIDRPLPVVDDRLDVQALERVSLPERQAAPYLALLVSTIYADAEKAFGRDKAKKGYKAAQLQAFGGDTSALAGPDLAGKLPKV